MYSHPSNIDEYIKKLENKIKVLSSESDNKTIIMVAIICISILVFDK